MQQAHFMAWERTRFTKSLRIQRITCKEAISAVWKQSRVWPTPFPIIQQLVAEIYSICDCCSINDARYQRFCSEGRASESQNNCHQQKTGYFYTVNVQTMSLLLGSHRCHQSSMYQTQLDVDGIKMKQLMRWKLNRWTKSQHPLLEFLSCACKKSGCKNNKWIWVTNGMKCTDFCDCAACSNIPPDEDELDFYELFGSDDDE